MHGGPPNLSHSNGGKSAGKKGRGKGGKSASAVGPRRRLEVPASSWPVIIGKGGETLRELQEQFKVRITVPRRDAGPDEAVTIQGDQAASDACEAHIQELVESMGRAKANSKKRPSPNSGGARLFPQRCALCDRGVGTTLREAFEHLGSAQHTSSTREHLKLPASETPSDSPGFLEVVEFLREESVRDLHAQLGYDVAGLAGAAPEAEGRRVAAVALHAAIQAQVADMDWLTIEDRQTVRWQASPTFNGFSSSPKNMVEAPPLDEFRARCELGEEPPVVRLPALPVALPRLPPQSRKFSKAKAQHKWPLVPTSRLGIAAVLNRGLEFDGIDVICGTSLIKALAGDSSRTKDTYYLQRYQSTLVCLHVPGAFHTEDDAGHATEWLLCGSESHASFFALTTIRIGERRLLVSSEVDARDKAGGLVEVKSSSSRSGSSILRGVNKILQVALNGSEHVLACQLDKDSTHLEKVDWINTRQAIELHSEGFKSAGRRVKLLLEQVLGDPCLQRGGSSEDIGDIFELTFDDIKVPMIKPAPEGIAVLPAGL